MAKYIDSDKLFEDLDKYAPARCNTLTKMIIAQQPAADVVEVTHGQWIEEEHGFIYECSVCKNPTDYRLSKYCPCCGAKMDKKGGADNDEKTLAK